MVGGQEGLSPTTDIELGKGRRKEGTAAAKRVAAVCRGNDQPQGATNLRRHSPAQTHSQSQPCRLGLPERLGVGWGGGRCFSKRRVLTEDRRSTGQKDEYRQRLDSQKYLSRVQSGLKKATGHAGPWGPGRGSGFIRRPRGTARGVQVLGTSSTFQDAPTYPLPGPWRPILQMGKLRPSDRDVQKTA